MTQYALFTVQKYYFYLERTRKIIIFYHVFLCFNRLNVSVTIALCPVCLLVISRIKGILVPSKLWFWMVKAVICTFYPLRAMFSCS